MTIERNDPRLVFMPESDVLKASGHCDVMKNKWFAVCPERGLIFWQTITKRKDQLISAAPQCNGTRAIAQQLGRALYPWAEIKFFETVIVPINVGDY